MIKEAVITLCDKCETPIRGEYDIVTSTLEQPGSKHTAWHICGPCGRNIRAELIRIMGSPGQPRYSGMFGRPTTSKDDL